MGSLSLKKQTFSSITVAGTSPRYIFVGGSTGNTLDAFFNKNEFTQGTSTADSDIVQTIDTLGVPRNYFIRASDSTWRRSGSALNQGSIPINVGQSITFTTYNNIQKTFTMIGNNLLAKENLGKTNINKQNLGGGKLNLKKNA